jgi:hypothetical protein
MGGLCLSDQPPALPKEPLRPADNPVFHSTTRNHTMSGRDPRELLAKAAGKGKAKSAKRTRHMKEATVLAELFGKLSVQLAAGEVEPARKASHRAHALLEVLEAMDRQDEHPELASPKCDERQQAARAWSRLMRPTSDTTAELRGHFEDRRFSFIRLAPLPPLPAPKPRETYKGGIYQTVFVPNDAKLAKKLGLPESYTFRHGVTNAGFKLSLLWAIERKLPSIKQDGIYVRPILRGAPGSAMGYAFNWLEVQQMRQHWRDGARDVRYSIHSTTNAEAAAELAAERSGKKLKGVGKLS